MFNFFSPGGDELSGPAPPRLALGGYNHDPKSFGRQIFMHAVALGRQRYGSHIMTVEQWAREFSSAVFQLLPENVSRLYEVACAEGVGSLMMNSQDEQGAGAVVCALYGRYFETHGGYPLYLAYTVEGERCVVILSGDDSLRFVTLLPP